MTVKEFIAKHNITATQTRVHSRPDELMDFDKDARHWEVVLRYMHEVVHPKEFSIYFTQGSAHTKTPAAEDVLVSVLMDIQNIDGQNFSDWASDLGYSDDSIKALNIYKACLKENEDMKAWLGQEKYNEFIECEE